MKAAKAAKKAGGKDALKDVLADWASKLHDIEGSGAVGQDEFEEDLDHLEDLKLEGKEGGEEGEGEDGEGGEGGKKKKGKGLTSSKVLN